MGLGMKELVSVVMPVYNRETTIKEALDSIILQTYKNIEIIIVDDGSIDRTLHIIEQYSDARIKIIKLAHTGNIAHVRNIGLKHAKGDYIAIMDSDDVCYYDRVERQLNEFSANPNIDILATWVEFIEDYPTGRKEILNDAYNNCFDNEEFTEVMINGCCCICHSSVMMKKIVVDLLQGYDEKFQICEDYNMWIEALIKGFNIKVMPTITVKRRLHCDSVTNVYNGTDIAIYNVIKIKLKYLLMSGLLESKKVYVLGNNKRNEILKKVIVDNKFNIVIEACISEFEKINVTEENIYYFVTTFSRREEALLTLKYKGKKTVYDYLYV